MTRYIFITGGVVSSVGKGLTSASLGCLLERRGLKVRMQKLDPYVNVDPGTMSPYQHGEVYVTSDGAETDLDLGHYERFTSNVLTGESSITTGKIYLSVINKERRGDFLGATVQVVPHITNEIKERIRALSGDDVDVVICEVGGTVGDIESLPFLEAIRQLRKEEPSDHCLSVHVGLIPFLKAADELKTKPMQHSVQKLREIGIYPDIIMCRTEKPIDTSMREKLSLFCNVPMEAVIEQLDAKDTIYQIPLVLHQQGVDDLVCQRLKLKTQTPALNDLKEILDATKNPQGEVEIAVVGKYIEHQDAYKSIYESLTIAGLTHKLRIKIRRVEATEVESGHLANLEGLLQGVDGVLVPGGFGDRGVEGKILVSRWARQNQIPYFGICLGMQVCCIDMARDLVSLEGAHSSEFDKNSSHQVICLLEEQKEVVNRGGTMRLGSYPCHLSPDTKAQMAYQKEVIQERHRHRYEFNNAYREQFASHGIVFSGLSPDGELVEIVELKDHPWFVGVQFHPEFQSRLSSAHPLFREFVAAAYRQHQKENYHESRR